MAFNRLLGNLATDLDSAATGTFLSRDDVADADFVSIAYTDLTQRPSTIDSAGLTSLIDSAYIQARQSAAVSTGLDSAAATALFDSDYVSARTTTTTTGFKEYQYTATSGQTTFQDSDNNSQVLSYSPGGVLVFYNGILMRKGALRDYQEGSNSITLNTGADSGANITIAKWQVNTVDNDYTFLGAGGGSVITADANVTRARGGTADTVTDATNLNYQYERVDGSGDILSYSSLPAFDLNTASSSNNRIVFAFHVNNLSGAQIGISLQDNSGNRSNWATYNGSLVHIFGTQTQSYTISWTGFAESKYYIVSYDTCSTASDMNFKAKEVGDGNSVVTVTASSSNVGYAPAYLTNNNSMAWYGASAGSPLQGYTSRNSMSLRAVGVGTCPATISAADAIAQFESLMFK